MDLTVGILLVVAGGALEGLFSLPVTRTPRWKWENIWGLGSLVALVLVPWPVAFLTVPHLFEVFREAGPGVLAMTFLFGVGWGLGGIFWGKGIAALGMALGISILMGLVTVFSSPVLLAMKHGPAMLLEPGGLILLAAVAAMILGVAVCAVAGAARQRDLDTGASAKSKAVAAATPFAIGLLFCLVSGVFSALLNFGFVYGSPIQDAAHQVADKYGASPAGAPNAIWALVFTANYLVNAAYGFILMIKNKTAGRIVSEGSAGYWLWALFMGIAWPLGVVLYGIGAGRMGTYGPFVGFPMLLVMAMLFGNLAGAATGEWRGASAKTKVTMLAGVLVLVAAFALFGVAQHKLPA